MKPNRPQCGNAMSLQSWLIVVSLCSCPALASETTVDFNRDIRPILSNRCFRCHGPDEAAVQAGLRLDLPNRATARLESGETAIVPGDITASALVGRVTSGDSDYRMPPPQTGEPLSPQQIELLTQWIDQGAQYRRHWSFESPRRPSLHNVSEPSWTANPIDAFVLGRLDHEDLTHAAVASKNTLVRRLSLDLTGLPPTIDEVEDFCAHNGPDAYDRLVDCLLASPAYGERWARVWLDLARYADSAGYAQDPPRVIWKYRDWVIDAINANTPFDQFTIEQLAGDMLPEPSEDQLIATAFHRNTMTNSEGGTDDEEFRNAAIVDRVNTTMQVWMGLTMGCAQCHNHKYDPVTQEEYFRFFAVFNNTQDADRGDESPTLESWTPKLLKQKRELKQQIEKLQRELASERPWTDLPEGPLMARHVRVELPGKNRYLSLAEVEVFVGEQNIATSGKAKQSSVAFGGPARLAIDGNSNGNYQEAKSTTHTAEEANPWWEVELAQPVNIEQIRIWSRTDDGMGGRLSNFRVVVLDTMRRPLWVANVADAPDPNVQLDLPVAAAVFSAAQRKERWHYIEQDWRDVSPQQRQLNELQEKLAGMKGIPTPIMRELPQTKRRETHIQIRGNFKVTGKQVGPGVPASFLPLDEAKQANRMSVARWLVDRRNPLTARVVVNRFWEQLFGIGIVETSEDFGRQGELPSHPELLDYLALELMRNGWDTKALLRMIVTSTTYRQSSHVSGELRRRDPANRLMARGPRFRLSAEMIRDQALFVAGLLSRKMHGPSVRPPRPVLGLRAAFGGSTDWQANEGEDRYRRGLYTRWRRTTPYPSMTTFDAPSREFCTLRRIRTNTPLQALVTLNDPAFVEAAQALARRVIRESGPNNHMRATHMFRLCLSRLPVDKELQRLLQLYRSTHGVFESDHQRALYMASDPIGAVPSGLDVVELAAWTVVANVVMNLDEFVARR